MMNEEQRRGRGRKEEAEEAEERKKERKKEEEEEEEERRNKLGLSGFFGLSGFPFSIKNLIRSINSLITFPKLPSSPPFPLSLVPLKVSPNRKSRLTFFFPSISFFLDFFFFFLFH